LVVVAKVLAMQFLSSCFIRFFLYGRRNMVHQVSRGRTLANTAARPRPRVLRVLTAPPVFFFFPTTASNDFLHPEFVVVAPHSMK
jgi:hypothetical protein